MSSSVCTICNRSLKNPESVERGIGPICWGKIRHGEPQSENESPDAIPKLPMDPETMDVICRRDPFDSFNKEFNVPHRIVDHSPTGMEWGYGGSGPADFALNILALFAGEKFAREHYQAFKWEFVANLPSEGGVIRGVVIRAWIKTMREGPLSHLNESPRLMEGQYRH